MADENEWDLQQILRQPHPSDTILRQAISDSPIAKKTILLRSIRSHLDGSSSALPESILHHLELLRDLDRAAPASMKLAYCDVAVACTMKHLGGEAAGGFAAAVERIWKGRVEKIGRTDGLFSEELSLWRAKIEKATVDQRIDYTDIAVKSVEKYLDSAWAAMESPVRPPPAAVPARNRRRQRRAGLATAGRGGKSRRTKLWWSEYEVEALIKGVKKHGEGRWQEIKKDHREVFGGAPRSAVDLKDKWRNMNKRNKY